MVESSTANMGHLVDIINQLQEVFSASGQTCIDLPQIVVVGTQSSGKSSVLEQIVGKSFLPRGNNIVTRCPLILQLVSTQESTTQHREYAVFQHDKSKSFTDYDLIRKEIEEETVRIAGGNSNICSTPIILKLHSPDLINLTLVDLPGLTKVPVGDQPIDIETQIRSLVQDYIKNPDAIIVAVTPANIDMANSESIKIAREVDPDGVRTLAVITKLDLMDKGTDAWDVLVGKIIPVKLGIIGVVNRSQEDIKQNKPIAESLKDESKFLKANYETIADFHGSIFLAKRVQELLVNHIKNIMPQLKENIQQKLSSKNAELRLINKSTLDKPELLLEFVSKLSRACVDAVKGHLTHLQADEKLFGGAKILQVFRESFSIDLRNVDVFKDISKQNIITAMQNSSGVNSSIFVSEAAFELVVKKQIDNLRGPCLKCVDNVRYELNGIIQSSILDKKVGLYRYPELQKEMSVLVKEIVENLLPITNQMVNYFMDVQLSYINKNHPDFLPNSASWQQELISQNKYTHQPQAIMISSTEKGEKDYNMITKLIESYFLVMKKIIHDTVPKIIMHSLVNHLVENLQNELIKRLYNSAEDLLEESKDVVRKRDQLQAEVKALELAIGITQQIFVS